MKTKLFFSAIFLFAIILGGCENTSNNLQDDANSTQKKKPVERPIELNGRTFSKFIPPGPESLCGEEKGTMIVEGVGDATHMGRIEITGHHCFQGSCIWGPLDFKAANGDILYTRCGEDEEGNTYMFCQEGDAITSVGPGLIVGGTGRFEGATGSLNWTVTVLNDGAEIEAKGIIVY